MKVYLLTAGDYSAYTVLGVFSTPEKAEAARGLLQGYHPSDDTENELEEFELDGVPDHPPGYLLWSVRIMKAGDVPEEPVQVGAASGAGEFQFVEWLYLRVWALDAAHAVKIAGERRAQLIALGKWPEVRP